MTGMIDITIKMVTDIININAIKLIIKNQNNSYYILNYIL